MRPRVILSFEKGISSSFPLHGASLNRTAKERAKMDEPNAAKLFPDISSALMNSLSRVRFNPGIINLCRLIIERKGKGKRDTFDGNFNFSFFVQIPVDLRSRSLFLHF